MASKSKKKKITTRQALAASAWDTLQVVMYSGVPATGVIVLVNTMSTDVPSIAKYAPYIATTINVIIFYIKRAMEYIQCKRELPEFLQP